MNAITSRAGLAGLAGQSFDGARDLYRTMGYPRTIDPAQYVEVYQRQDIAGRIVDAYPNATWREPPAIVGNDALSREMPPESPLWRTLHRLDRLTGLGHYGVLLIGVDGGVPLDQPLRGTDHSLIYAQPHGERTASVLAWDSDPTSARYGKPLLYQITTGTNWTGIGAGRKIVNVHHSRVIHVAEMALEDESIGTPRLERIFNRLMDLDKLLGGSAEMYWQNVGMLMQLKADLGVQWDPEEAQALADQIEEMQHGLRRWLRTRGVEAENIAPGLQGADPSNHIDRQLDMIAGATGIPKRILIGSEAGELASSQDENNWNSRVEERRQQHAGPAIAVPFIRKLQEVGAMPTGAFTLEWPESDTLGDAGRADIALKTAQAVSTYANSPGAELIVSPDEFRRTMGYDEPIDLPGEDELLTAGEKE